MNFSDTTIAFSGSLSAALLPASLAPPASDVFHSAAIKGIYIGRSEHLSIPVFWNNSIYPNGHCCVTGMTGSGKTYFMKSFIARASSFLNANIFIIDWTGEYVNWCNESSGTTIDISSTAFNMFPSFDCATSREQLADLSFIISIVCDLDTNETRLISDALIALHSSLSSSKPYPTISEIMYSIKSECGREVFSKLKSSEAMLSKILTGESNIDLLFGKKKILCLDFSRLHREKERVLLAHVVLHAIVQRMRFVSSSDSFIIIDEAWRVLRKRTTETLLREGRKYSHHLLLATQNIADFDDTLFSNFSSFFVFRTQSHQERERLRLSLLLDSGTVSRLADLRRGQCLCRFSLTGKQSISFFLKIVEGEEGIVWYTLKGGKGGNGMEIQIERDFMMRRLRELGITSADASDISNVLDSRRNEISLVDLCRKLRSKGISNAQAIMFMRSISISDDVIVNVLAELQDSESNLIDVVLSDQSAQK